MTLVREAAARFVDTPRRFLADPTTRRYPLVELSLIGLPVAAALVWWLSFRGADPLAMTRLGLISLFSAGNVVALVLLAAGVVIGLHRNASEWVLGLHLVTYLCLIHGTPAALYGTLRYAWAWKHVGIVDYISRTGTVDPGITVGDIYHNWPGFFAASALLTSVAGQADAVLLATWFPLAFNLVNLLVIRYVYRGLTSNKRLIWLSLWLYFIITWVGQDYFSPQAMAYLLYLACVGLLIRQSTRWPVVLTFTAAAGTIAVTHQITPIMLVIAVTALVLLRRIAEWYLPVLALALVLLWGTTGAAEFTLPNIRSFFETFGHPFRNAEETLAKGSNEWAPPPVVVWGGRSVVLLSTGLALVGAWRSWRVNGLRVTALLLMILPGTLILVTGFGGEVVFRAVLFATPFVAFLAAAACLPVDGRAPAKRHVVIASLVTAALLPGFLLGYYGKERDNYFTPDEVRAATWVDTHAVPGSLLVEGSKGYPAQYKNYERFTYVDLSTEPTETTAPLLEDPAGVLAEWLRDPRYANAYVILMRSQKYSVAPLPPLALKTITDALRMDETFRVVFANADATVFALATDPLAPPDPVVSESPAGGDRAISARLLLASTLLLVLPGLGWALKFRAVQSRFDHGDTVAMAVVFSTMLLTAVATTMAVSSWWSPVTGVLLLTLVGVLGLLPLRTFGWTLRQSMWPSPRPAALSDDASRAWAAWYEEGRRQAEWEREQGRAEVEAEAAMWSDWYKNAHEGREPKETGHDRATAPHTKLSLKQD